MKGTRRKHGAEFKAKLALVGELWRADGGTGSARAYAGPPGRRSCSMSRRSGR